MKNESAEKKGRPFEPGNQFGRGRPRGSRNRQSRRAQELLENHSEALMKTALVVALKGDIQMLRILLGHLLGKNLPMKTGPLLMGTAEELSKTSADVVKQLTAEQITLAEAQGLFGLMETRRNIIETTELEQRLRAIEERDAKRDRK